MRELCSCGSQGGIHFGVRVGFLPGLFFGAVAWFIFGTVLGFAIVFFAVSLLVIYFDIKRELYPAEVCG